MRYIPGLLSAALLSCSPGSSVEPTRSFSLDRTFPLRVGEQVRLEDGSLRLWFEEVLEDSRCSTDVVCVWEGNARIRLTLAVQNAERTPLDLNTSLDPTAAAASGYVVELVRVEPDPKPPGKVARESYTAQLRVTRSP